MPTLNLGRIGSVPKGNWVAGTYKKLDIVRHNGAAWQCKAATTTTQEPSDVASDWMLLTRDSGVALENLGTNPNEVPLVGYLGRYAFMSPNDFSAELVASATPHKEGEMVFQLTSNTSLTIKVKGTDGVIRSANITLA